MNKKFKIVLTATVAALAIGAGQVNAQNKVVTFGVKAGANLSTFGGDAKDMKYAFKYQVGITADVAFTENLYLLSGLNFQTQGGKFKPSSGESVKFNPMYLQLPAHIGYKFDLGSDIRLVVNAGPYAAFGIGGKSKSGGESQKLFGDNRFKRFDYGVGGGLGVEFGHFSVAGGYDWGLNDINDAEGDKIQNRNAYLTLGYKF